MDFLDLSRFRYACKLYDHSRRVGEDDFRIVLEAMRLAPSGVNTQPWKFFYTDDEAGRNRLRPAIPEFNRPRYDTCSHVILIAAARSTDREWLRKVIEAEDFSGRFASAELKEQRFNHCVRMIEAHADDPGAMLANNICQCYIALAAGMYAAASLKIDSTPIGGFDRTAADTILDLPGQGLTAAVMLLLGYRSPEDPNDPDRAPKSRLPFAEIVHKI